MEEKKVITLADIKEDGGIKELIQAANRSLEVRGYTEHGLRHCGYVSHTTANLLKELGYEARVCELGEIAGWIHDIGNSVNRNNHGQIGAALAFSFLTELKMDMREVAKIVGAIGNHEEESGVPVNEISAALILADKSDAHRTRVRRDSYDASDIHDRVNYSIKKNSLVVDRARKCIRLVIYMDDGCSPMEYLQIYMSRMTMCEQSAAFLKNTFELVINDAVINRHKNPDLAAKLNKGEKAVSADEVYVSNPKKVKE